jgi:hypothetical protein
VAGGLSPAAPDARFGRPTRPKASRKPKPRDCNYAVPSLQTYRSSKKLDSNPIDYIRLSSMNSIGSAHADHPAPRERSHVSTPDRILFINGTLVHLPARVHLESAEVDRRLLERQLIDRLSSIPAVDAVAKTTALHWATTTCSGSSNRSLAPTHRFLPTARERTPQRHYRRRSPGVAASSTTLYS